MLLAFIINSIAITLVSIERETTKSHYNEILHFVQNDK